MIEHEMLFLGLLMDGPKHGYEIKRVIEEELFPIVGLKVKSIYYPLRKMEQLKLVNKDVGREGKWPEKFVYSITPQGRKVFNLMIMESFLSIERPYFNIDLAFYFLQYADKKIVRRKLKGRIIFLHRIKRGLEELKKKSDPSRKYLHIILQHDLDLVDAEINSNTQLSATIEAEDSLSSKFEAHSRAK
ncbi:MAG: PadR family transcriptional regulator [Candidatus Omnitrophota bacterium]|nr:PadR family transcriptional regulator [Candidatus Omnitrophota bacterium]MDZ4243450.1 PadR family transcriptional regulator [Candidatus Omnitrophota bacterium]